MKDVDRNIVYKNMALGGICGAVIYGIADMFLYLGTDIFSEDIMACGTVASDDIHGHRRDWKFLYTTFFIPAYLYWKHDLIRENGGDRP